MQLLGILGKCEDFDKFRKHNYNSEKKEERVFFKNKLQFEIMMSFNEVL